MVEHHAETAEDTDYQPEVVIITLDRLKELTKENHLHLCSLYLLSCLVMDETDKVVVLGHFVEFFSC